MTPEERMARGLAADKALDQFLSPAFDFVLAEYTRKLTEIAAEQPWETDKIRKLAAGIKIAGTVREQIVALVRDGDAAHSERKRADQLANLSDTKRRWAAMAGGR